MLRVKEKNLSGDLLSEKEVKAVEELASLIAPWGIEDHSVLVNYYALRLLGYEVEKYDERPHIDLVVDRDKLGWHPGEMREIIPPKNSPYFEQWSNYIDFLSSIGLSLHMIPLPSQELTGLGDKFTLPDSQMIRVSSPYQNVAGFMKDLIRYKKLPRGAFDQGEIDRWKKKILYIKRAGEKVSDEKLLGACDDCNKILDELAKLQARI